MDYLKNARRVVAKHTQHGKSHSAAAQELKITSISTERNYRQRLKNYLYWCDQNNVHPDFNGNILTLNTYLEERSEWVKQKTLDQERQALSLIYRQKLPYRKSQKISVYEKRSYTLAQVNEIINHQIEKNALTSLLSFFSGIRAHEAATLLPANERGPSSHRHWDTNRFAGLSSYRLYTVVGKGGLCRQIAVPLWLSKKIEKRRVSPKEVIDREIKYQLNYDIGFGQAWSQSFSAASKAALGFSRGGHGLRHSCAKWRLSVLIKTLELNPFVGIQNIEQQALLILSQELGHFRIDITYCYLR